MDRELPLRIVWLDPLPGVHYVVQSGRKDLVPPSRTTSRQLVFDFSVRVRDDRPDGQPNFLGAFAQGPRDARFVYVNSGTYAGQTDTAWARRAKIPLAGITWQMIDEAAGGILEARIPGVGSDGGPTCATVRNFTGWSPATR